MFGARRYAVVLHKGHVSGVQATQVPYFYGIGRVWWVDLQGLDSSILFSTDSIEVSPIAKLKNPSPRTADAPEERLVPVRELWLCARA